jgi:hypothetical protein
MPQKLMDVFMLGRCSHEFSWPRRGADGDYYQVCLLCAAEYKYDWATMRRTERVEHANETGIRRAIRGEKRPSWVHVPAVRSSISPAVPRHQDSSRGGNIRHQPERRAVRRSLPVNALIEMVFEMPEEISGEELERRARGA